MAKLFIEDLPVQGKKVLVRADFNVPLDNDKNVVDPTKIEAALPSIRYLLKQGAAVILMSHLGRPKHVPTPNLSLLPVAKILKGALSLNVTLAPDCIGFQVRDLVSTLQPGQVLLLENLRFHRQEEFPEEDPSFAKELASFGDFYVNDAFGACHRKHSSTYTITQYFPQKAACGYLIQKELKFLGEALTTPQKPFYALIGGAKVSTKLKILSSLLKKVDKLLIGGAMAYTFLKCRGIPIGDSLFEPDQMEAAQKLLDSFPHKIILPVDIVGATQCSEDAPSQIFDLQKGIPTGYQGLDIGPKTQELFSNTLKEARTILWNGPVGVYELDRFAKGTEALGKTLGALDAITIVAGGDIIAALKELHLEGHISHFSTGGGATLEFIEEGTLPGIEALSEK